MSAEQAKAVVEEYFHALGRQDKATLFRLHADDMELILPGSSKIPWAGAWRGEDQLRRCLQLIYENLEIRRHKLLKMFGEGNDVALVISEISTSKTTGREFRQFTAWHFRVRDSKIARLHIFEDTEAIAGCYD